MMSGVPRGEGNLTGGTHLLDVAIQVQQGFMHDVMTIAVVNYAAAQEGESGNRPMVLCLARSPFHPI